MEPWLTDKEVKGLALLMNAVATAVMAGIDSEKDPKLENVKASLPVRSLVLRALTKKPPVIDVEGITFAREKWQMEAIVTKVGGQIMFAVKTSCGFRDHRTEYFLYTVEDYIRKLIGSSFVKSAEDARKRIDYAQCRLESLLPNKHNLRQKRGGWQRAHA